MLGGLELVLALPLGLEVGLSRVRVSSRAKNVLHLDLVVMKLGRLKLGLGLGLDIIFESHG